LRLSEVQRLSQGTNLVRAEKGVGAAVHLVRKELTPRPRSTKAATSRSAKRRNLVAAAKKLLPDYCGDRELTAFTSLDAEDFIA